jgi:signal transduction histidine kinase
MMLLLHRGLLYAMGVLGLVFGGLLLWLLVPERFPSGTQSLAQVAACEQPIHGVGFDEPGFRGLLRRDLATGQAPYKAANARWASVGFPVSRELPASTDKGAQATHRLWLRFRYQVPDQWAAHEHVGIYVTRLMAGIGGGHYSLWVNGDFVKSNEAEWRMQWNHPLLVKLPLRYSQPGLWLDVAIGVPFQMSQGYGVGQIMAGPASALQPRAQLRELVQVTFPKAMLLTLLLIGALSLNFWLRRKTEETHLVMWLSSVAWLVSILQWVMDFDANHALSAWFGSLVDSATGWAILLISMFFARVDGRGAWWIERVCMALVLLMTVLTLPWWDWQRNALLLQHYVHIVMGATLLSIIVWRAMVAKRLDMWLLVGAMLTMLIFGVHDITQITSHVAPDHVFLFPYTVVVVFGVFLHLNQKRYLATLAEIDATNSRLQQDIDAAKGQIKLSYAQRMALDKQRALMDERQQLSSDVHDGLGSALTSAIVLTERGEPAASELIPALHDCLVEAQAVADSIRTIPGQIADQLAAMEARLAPRLKAAGIASVWSYGGLPPVGWMDQQASNDLSRMLQETISNAIKHAAPSLLRVEAAACELHGQAGVGLVVSDDGCGFELAAVRTGRGLKNLNMRTQRLGGHFDVASSAGRGCKVSIWLPLVKAS